MTRRSSGDDGVSATARRCSMTRRSSAVRGDAVADLYVYGFDVTEIAVMWGVGCARVRARLRSAGVPLRPHVRRPTFRLAEGSRKVTWAGYMERICRGHPRARTGGYVGEHILVVEAALGKYVDARHPIHHVNGVRNDNRPENLVLCEDVTYHALLHVRQAALDACGNPDWRRCGSCGVFDSTDNMVPKRRKRPWHGQPYRHTGSSGCRAALARVRGAA